MSLYNWKSINCQPIVYVYAIDTHRLETKGLQIIKAIISLIINSTLKVVWYFSSDLIFPLNNNIGT